MSMRNLVFLASLLLFLGSSAEAGDGSSNIYSDKASFMAAVSSGQVPKTLGLTESRENVGARNELWRSVVTVLDTSYGAPVLKATYGNVPPTDEAGFNEAQLASCLSTSQYDILRILKGYSSPTSAPQDNTDKSAKAIINRFKVNCGALATALDQFFVDYKAASATYMEAKQKAPAPSEMKVAAASPTEAPIPPQQVATAADVPHDNTPQPSNATSTSAAPVEASRVADSQGPDLKAALMAKIVSGEFASSLKANRSTGGNPWKSVIAVLRADYGFSDDDKTCTNNAESFALDKLVRVSQGIDTSASKFSNDSCSPGASFITAFNRFLVDYSAAASQSPHGQAQQARQVDESRSQMLDTAALIVLAVALIMAVWGIVLGLRTKVIFYGSGKDVFITLAMVVVGVAVTCAPAFIEKEHPKLAAVLIPVLFLVSICVIFMHTRSIDREMSAFNALCVTFGKIILFALAFAQLTRGNDRNSSELKNLTEKISGAAIFLAIGYLIGRLTNRNRFFAMRLANQFGLRASKANLADVEDWLENHLDGEISYDNYDQVYQLFSSEVSAAINEQEAAA